MYVFNCIRLRGYNLLIPSKNVMPAGSKGSIFWIEDNNYSTSLHLLKNYDQLLKSNSVTQLINEPTEKHYLVAYRNILINISYEISQYGVIEKGFWPRIYILR